MIHKQFVQVHKQLRSSNLLSLLAVVFLMVGGVEEKTASPGDGECLPVQEIKCVFVVSTSQVD